MLSLGALWSALTGTGDTDAPVAQRQFADIAIDSRRVQEGSLFVALRGERQDGHEFVADAFGRGAVAALVSRPVGCGTSVRVQGPCLQVPDVLCALQDAAAAWRRRHPRCRVVAVTGSIGKTSTKEAIAAVLASAGRVLKSEGNFNNEIGLPLTLFRLGAEHTHAVLEMGMYAAGEIARLAQIAGPDVGVITNVGPVHLERLGSVDAIARAKAELAESLPDEGTLIVNGDDARVAAMAQATRARRLVRFGLGPECDVRASDVIGLGLEGFGARISHCGTSVQLELPWLGKHNVYVALAACAVGVVEGLQWPAIDAGLRGCANLGRLRVLRGAGGVTILDDTYNASPASSLADLDLLSELPGRHLAVLGDMLEMGTLEEEGHRQVGQRAGEVLSVLAAVGKRARWIAEEAQRRNPALIAWSGQDREAAVAWLRTQVLPGDHLLVKASRGMALEEVVAALAEEES